MTLSQYLIRSTGFVAAIGLSFCTCQAQVTGAGQATDDQAGSKQVVTNPYDLNFSALPTLNSPAEDSKVVKASISVPVPPSRVEASVSGLADSFGSAYSALDKTPNHQPQQFLQNSQPVTRAAAKPLPRPQPGPVSRFNDSFGSAYSAMETIPNQQPQQFLQNSRPVARVAANPLPSRQPGLVSGIPELGEKNSAKADSLSEQKSGDSILSTTEANAKQKTFKGDFKAPGPRAGQQDLDMSDDVSPSLQANLAGEAIWWRQYVQQPIHAGNAPIGVDSNSLVYETLVRSPRIRALSQDPLIRELQIVEANSEFDPVAFIQSQFQDRVDPVGDSLSITNDGTAFLQDHIWTGNAGIRKKARTGAEWELSQQLGFRNSNSNFFTPQDQGTATLALNVTQPLLRGRGRYINQTQILIAQAATGGAWNTFLVELQDEVQATVDAYWRLYFDRSVYLQKRKNVDRGEVILRTLEGRRDLDSLPSQIARARSAVQSRKTDLANAYRDIRNSETELRRLTANRNWAASQSIEMIPIELPNIDAPPLGLENVVYTALENRPEIKEAISRSKIAAVQRDISENELLPELSLLLGTYVSALQGESQLFEAVQDQFGGVKPGYNVGFEYELPFRNRAARTRFAQRQLQIVKIRAEIDEVMQNVVAESQVSLRRVASAKETMQAAQQAIDAARVDLEQNFRRWESFALIEGDIADGRTPTTVLDQLLDSQERLTSAELVFSQSELELKTAEVALLRTMGTLLIHRNVNFNKSYNGDRPNVEISQSANQFVAPAVVVENQPHFSNETVISYPLTENLNLATPVSQ